MESREFYAKLLAEAFYAYDEVGNKPKKTPDATQMALTFVLKDMRVTSNGDAAEERAIKLLSEVIKALKP